MKAENTSKSLAQAKAHAEERAREAERSIAFVERLPDTVPFEPDYVHASKLYGTRYLVTWKAKSLAEALDIFRAFELVACRPSTDGSFTMIYPATNIEECISERTRPKFSAMPEAYPVHLTGDKYTGAKLKAYARLGEEVIRLEVEVTGIAHRFYGFRALTARGEPWSDRAQGTPTRWDCITVPNVSDAMFRYGGGEGYPPIPNFFWHDRTSFMRTMEGLL